MAKDKKSAHTHSARGLVIAIALTAILTGSIGVLCGRFLFKDNSEQDSATVAPSANQNVGNDEDEDDDVDDSDISYIYLDKYGIKLEVPSDEDDGGGFTSLSYLYDEANGTVKFWGVSQGFASYGVKKAAVLSNTLGAPLMTIEVREKGAKANCPSCTHKITDINGYDVYSSIPKSNLPSSDIEIAEWYHDSSALLESWLNDEFFYEEIYVDEEYDGDEDEDYDDIDYEDEDEDIDDDFRIGLAASSNTVKVGGYAVDNVKSLGKITLDGSGAAVLKVAASQKGNSGRIVKIKGKERRISYYNNVWYVGQHNKNYPKNKWAAIPTDQTGNWCSEFATWAMATAGVPTSKLSTSVKKFPTTDSVAQMSSLFSDRNRLFKFHNATEKTKTKKAQTTWFKYRKSAGTMKLDNLRPGDILQILSSKSKTVPHHTAIYVSHSGKKVKVYEGNVDHTKTHSYVRTTRTYDANQIIAVARPEYTDNISIDSIKNEGVGDFRIKFSGLDVFSKNQYAITITDTTNNKIILKDYKLEHDRHSVLYTLGKTAGKMTSGRKYKITLRALVKKTGKVDNSFKAVSKNFTYKRSK
ncbi:hypothetical protein J5500_04280 [Candidatus Saccharibacteria bacterium]|nr:hypothetical protein [Candidatus Saccharibacteria bacterium]